MQLKHVAEMCSVVSPYILMFNFDSSCFALVVIGWYLRCVNFSSMRLTLTQCFPANRLLDREENHVVASTERIVGAAKHSLDTGDDHFSSRSCRLLVSNTNFRNVSFAELVLLWNYPLYRFPWDRSAHMLFYHQGERAELVPSNHSSRPYVERYNVQAGSLPRSSSVTVRPYGRIDDKIIDKALTLVKGRFPHVRGLQPCKHGKLPCFITERGEFIQIINTDYENGGQHWIVLSTVGVKQLGHINLFDTDPANPYTLNGTVERCIAKLLHCENDYIVVNIANCDKQGVSSNDCGPYAIAILFAIAYGLDPTQIKFKNYSFRLRRHLRSCLINNNCTRFPYIPWPRNNKIYSSHQIPVHCICRMPKTRNMLKCGHCSRFFHSSCVHYKGDAGLYFCQRCK